MALPYRWHPESKYNTLPCFAYLVEITKEISKSSERRQGYHQDPDLSCCAGLRCAVLPDSKGVMEPTSANSLAGRTVCVGNKVLTILAIALESMTVGGKPPPTR